MIKNLNFWNGDSPIGLTLKIKKGDRNYFYFLFMYILFEDYNIIEKTRNFSQKEFLKISKKTLNFF